MKLRATRLPLPRLHASAFFSLAAILLLMIGLGCSGIERPARSTRSDASPAPERAQPEATAPTAEPAAPSAPPPTPSAPAAANVQEPLAWVGPDPMDDVEWLVPPDGKWLTNEHGRRYFITRLRKVPGMTFVTPDRKTIVHKAFYEWPLEREDDEYFYIRKYEAVDDSEMRAVLDQQRREKEESAAKLAATYVNDLATADRLSFASFDQGLPQSGQWRQGFEIADIDGDGQLDIVHGPARKGPANPVVFLGDGAGQWRHWAAARWPGAPYDYGDVAVADVNGDGLADLGLGAHLRGVMVLIQRSPGVFEPWSEGLPFSVPGAGGEGTGFSSRAVEFADWNGDGRPDLVALGEGPRQMKTVRGKLEGLPTSLSYGFGVFLNNGDGTWETLAAGETQGVFGDALAIADFDDDGRVDAATVTYALGKRDILRLNRDEGRAVAPVELPTLREVSWIFGIASGDFDGDSRSDIVTSFGNSHGGAMRQGLDLSWRDATGAWQTRLLWTEPGYDAIWSVAAGDLEGDGNADLVAMTQTGRVLVLLGDGEGGFVLEDSPELAPPKNCRGYGTEIRDLDGDGGGEIVAAFAGEVGEMQKLMGVEGVADCPGGGALRAWRASRRLPGGAS